jgi:hypothetical protein
MPLTGCRKSQKFQNNRHPGAGRGPEAFDYIEPTALDSGFRRGDGGFFDTLLSWRLALVGGHPGNNVKAGFLPTRE